MPDSLNAVRSSADRLTDLVGSLPDDALTTSAYPSEWTIADVLSHLGSGTVIWQRMVDDALAGTEAPAEFNTGVWDEWNAKSPRQQADDGLAAIDAFTSRLEAVTDEERARFELTMGPMELDWSAALGMRLNETLLHEWDVAVAVDPSTALAADGTELVVDSLAMIASFSAKPSGEPSTITIETTDPVRRVAATIGEDSVTLGATDDTPDLTMPAEALIRLVYGRLDPDHTPSTVTGDRSALDQLRAVFPGF